MLSFLFFTPYLGTFKGDVFRDIAWSELWYFAGAVALLGAGAGAALLGVRALAKGEENRPYAVFFSFLLCGGVFLASRPLTGPFWGGAFDHVLAAGLVFLTLAAVLGPWRTMLRVCRAACAVLAPAAAAVLLGLPSASVALSRVSVAPAQGPERPAPAGLPHVFLLLFDAWSYDLTFPGGKIRDDMPNLRELLSVSTLYHQARSPALSTEFSVPAIFYGVPVTEPFTRPDSSLFSAPKRLGYRTRVVSLVRCDLWGLDGVDRFDIFPYYSKGPLAELPFAERFFVHFALGARPYLRAGRALNRFAPESAILASWTKQRAVQNIAISVIEGADRPTFAVFHYQLPHGPHVFDRQGLELGNERSGRGDVVRAGNLHRLDAVIGELAAALRRSGKFDEAALVLFSDHAEGESSTHVPLIIKRPGQRAAEEVGEPVELIGLHRYVERLIRKP